MEGEHTLTIIRLILSTDHALIQLKDSYFNSSLFKHMYKPNMLKGEEKEETECCKKTGSKETHIHSS